LCCCCAGADGLQRVAAQLVDKSADLSMASQLFYKQARKANSCCRFM
jgi:hypothetical protein